mmetsp:Transcript_5168/g.18290  ORF Transcript_5168/g.18290 Transcript_5168/m.18290 type:complete len:291 (+) Transcript_5168:166-1038(+)
MRALQNASASSSASSRAACEAFSALPMAKSTLPPPLPPSGSIAAATQRRASTSLPAAETEAKQTRSSSSGVWAKTKKSRPGCALPTVNVSDEADLPSRVASKATTTRVSPASTAALAAASATRVALWNCIAERAFCAAYEPPSRVVPKTRPSVGDRRQNGKEACPHDGHPFSGVSFGCRKETRLEPDVVALKCMGTRNRAHPNRAFVRGVPPAAVALQRPRNTSARFSNGKRMFCEARLWRSSRPSKFTREGESANSSRKTTASRPRCVGACKCDASRGKTTQRGLASTA